MGIKFLCPNGHKLHVKSFLGGKKAICPKCGARVTVPAESPQAQGEPDPGSTAEGSSIDSWSAEASSAIIAIAEASGANQPSTTGSGEGSAPAQAAVAESPPSPPADAIDEAPSAVWYVRPSTGGQFGPASGEIMRAWISEGRVGASSLVWRAGWPEWRSAAATFPQLGLLLASPGVAALGAHAILANAVSSGSISANGAQPPLGVGLPMGQVVRSVAADVPAGRPTEPAEDVPPLAQSLGVRPRRRNNDLNLIASIVLILISIILVIVLIVVFVRQNEPAEKPPQETQGGTPIHDSQLARRHG